MAVKINRSLYNKAKRVIPGGVNSPVRSFKAVGGYPVFIKNGRGSRIYGECGGEFIDYCASWGALLLGHAHPEIIKALEEALKNGTSFGAATKLEIDLAEEIIEAVPSIEKVRLTNSGTEAVMSAIRLARAYTGKDKLIKFDGAYHGHADYLLVKAGSGGAALGIPDSRGVPEDFTKHTILAPYNNIKKVGEAAEKYKKSLAAIIVEPVMGNMGVIVPEPGFLQGLRKISDRYNVLLIFDEVITGFRLSYGGAQKYFNIKPDLTCLGKIIGGGMPAAAFGGRADIMGLLAPLGNVYQAGTLSGNPIAVTAGIAALKWLKEKNPYPGLEKKTKGLCGRIISAANKYKIKIKLNSISSMFSVFFTDREVIDSDTAKTQDTDLFKRFFHGLLKEGVYLSPSGFETDFLSTAHSDEDIAMTLDAVDRVLRGLKR